MPDTYTCKNCKGTFQNGWTEEEAREEQKENGWGDKPDSEMVILCEDCYNKVMEFHKKVLETVDAT